jgi:hypothetical protein
VIGREFLAGEAFAFYMKTGAYPVVDARPLTPVSSPCAKARSVTCQTAQFSDAALPRFPKTPRAARPIFLFGVVGIVPLIAGSVFLGIAALWRDLRPRPRIKSVLRRLR